MNVPARDISARDTAARDIPARDISVRRVSFDHPALQHHFVGGDPVDSHVVACLSALFPEGEDFFVRSVRHYRDDVTDPELSRQVAGFIGQEVTHGREHRAFNRRLAELGYPTRGIDRFTRYLFVAVEKAFPRTWRLAVTSALEHYTATLAEVLLENPGATARFFDDDTRNLLLWHAIEESEHKSVAFDVFELVSGNYRLRTAIMDITTAVFLAVAIGGTVVSLLGDGSTYRHPVRLARSLARQRRSPWLTREVVRRIRDYNRRGFHPDDNNATEVLDRWRAELFPAA